MQINITESILISVTEIYEGRIIEHLINLNDIEAIVEIAEEETLIIMNFNDADGDLATIVVKESLNEINTLHRR